MPAKREITIRDLLTHTAGLDYPMIGSPRMRAIHARAGLLSPRTVEMITSGQLGFMYNGMDNFGLGFGVTSQRSAARDVRSEATFSWGGFFGTTYWADPKAHLVCLVMTLQTPNSHGELEKKVEQLIYQSFVK